MRGPYIVVVVVGSKQPFVIKVQDLARSSHCHSHSPAQELTPGSPSGGTSGANVVVVLVVVVVILSSTILMVWFGFLWGVSPGPNSKTFISLYLASPVLLTSNLLKMNSY